MSLGTWIQSTAQEMARLETELLASLVLKCTREQLYTRWDRQLQPSEQQKMRALVQKRKAGYPMAYILEQKEFFGIVFQVREGVFIPRPETETLVQAVIEFFPPSTSLRILDMGCGTGCIGFTLILHFPNGQLMAIDKEEKALKLCKTNAKQLGLTDRTQVIQQDLCQLNLKQKNILKNWKPHLITANPPYIAQGDPRLEKEVKAFEPTEALYSKNKGRFHLMNWLQLANYILPPKGHYFFEVGEGQNIMPENTPSSMNFHSTYKDLSGKDRIYHFQKA